MDFDNLHYNSRNVPQVAEQEQFEDLASTLAAIETELTKGTLLDRNMYRFFQQSFRPHIPDSRIAYRDHDVNQVHGGPQRRYVIEAFSDIPHLYMRLGISAPESTPLIPALQLLYLDRRSQYDFDAFAFDFTHRHHGRVEGAHVSSREAVRALGLIPIVNETILSDPTHSLEILRAQFQ